MNTDRRDAGKAKHAEGQHSFGVDGNTGKVVDMKTYGLYESAAVKVQILKTAIEVSFFCLFTEMSSHMY